MSVCLVGVHVSLCVCALVLACVCVGWGSFRGCGQGRRVVWERGCVSAVRAGKVRPQEQHRAALSVWQGRGREGEKQTHRETERIEWEKSQLDRV